MFGFASNCRAVNAHLQLRDTCGLHVVKHRLGIPQASVKNIGRVVQHMPSAELLPELQSPDLLPGIFEAFDHHGADVRKAVTMCLMYMWQVGCLRASVQQTLYEYMSHGADCAYTKLL